MTNICSPFIQLKRPLEFQDKLKDNNNDQRPHNQRKGCLFVIFKCES